VNTPDTIPPFVADMLACADGLVVDYDGTIADTGAAREAALAHGLGMHGVQLDLNWYRRHSGLGIADLLSQMPTAAGLDHAAVIRASRAQLLQGLDRIEPISSALRLVRLAREHGIPCAIASGTSGELVRPGLDALGLTDLFNAVVVREDTQRGKPAPDLYLEAARRIGVPAARCLAVDDADDGVEAARRARMTVLTLHAGQLVLANSDPTDIHLAPQAVRRGQ
jgi:beta-phosphoglucomutase-like phosphatase (HAD superfamily)